MKIRVLFILLSISMLLSSCKNNDESRILANEKEAKKKEKFFEVIDKAWIFNVQQSSAAVQQKISNWSEWRLFLSELNQKPKSSIGAFQQKAKILSTKVTDLNNHIPPSFDKPEIKSRIMTLTTKIKSLDLYINLSYIQEQKVLKLIPEINSEIESLQMQMEEIVRKSQIKLEEGEAEMIKSIRDSTSITPSKTKLTEEFKPQN